MKHILCSEYREHKHFMTVMLIPKPIGIIIVSKKYSKYNQENKKLEKYQI